MRYGMNMLLWAADTTPELFPVFDACKAIGYDGVEMAINADFDLANYAAIRAKLDDLGMAAIVNCGVTADANPVSPDAAVRARAVDRLRRSIDVAHAVGATLVNGPFMAPVNDLPGRPPEPGELERCADVMRAFADYARGAGVTLAIEPLNRFQAYVLNTVEQTVELVRAVGMPNFGICYDTYHANFEEKSVAAAIAAAAPHLAHVQLAENDRSTPGDGLVRWDETFAALDRAAYDGWLVVEAFGPEATGGAAALTRSWRKTYGDRGELARRALAFVKAKRGAA